MRKSRSAALTIPHVNAINGPPHPLIRRGRRDQSDGINLVDLIRIHTYYFHIWCTNILVAQALGAGPNAAAVRCLR